MINYGDTLYGPSDLKDETRNTIVLAIVKQIVLLIILIPLLGFLLYMPWVEDIDGDSAFGYLVTLVLLVVSISTRRDRIHFLRDGLKD